MAPGFLKPPWARIQANIVGDTANELTLTEDEEWIEPVMDLVPVNLFREQRAQRLGLASTVPSDPDTSSPEPEGCACTTVSGIGSFWVFLPAVLWRTRRKNP